MTPVYSIVVPARNAQSTLPMLLVSLERQTYAHDKFECIVVDDGSSDGTASILELWKSDIALQVITHPTNYGRSSSREAGWQAATGEIVIFLDSDMLPTERWLEELDAVFAASDIDVVSGHITNKSGIGQHPHAVFDVLQSEFTKKSDKHPLWMYAAFASNLAVRRSLLERTGGFNTFYPRFEDIELNLRLYEAGARYASTPQAVACHIGISSDDPLSLWFTTEELINLFVRHPHRSLLMASVWGRIELGKPENSIENCLEGLAEVFSTAFSAEDDQLLSLMQEVYGSQPEMDCRYNADEIIEGGIFRNYLTQQNGERIVKQGILTGLYSEIKDNVRLFDMQHSMNWLARCSEARVEQYPLPWSTYYHTPYQRTLLPSDAVAFHCKGVYEITLPRATLLALSDKAKINISVPIEHADQRNVVLSNCNPPNLLDPDNIRQGMIMRYAFSAGSDEVIKISYDFEYDIFEHVPVELKVPEALSEISAQYLKHGLPDAFIDKANLILNRVMPDPTADTYFKVRALFIWMWSNFEFIEYSMAFFELVNTGCGGCAAMVKLFISLLRLAGIPCREQSGIFYSNGLYTGRARASSLSCTQKTTGASPFIHTWAEFYTPERGWTPITEFESPARLTFLAMLSDDDRELVIRQSRRRCRAVFGSTSPFRTYGSDQANKLPTYPLVKTDKGWIADPDVMAGTLHRVTCQMEQI